MPDAYCFLKVRLLLSTLLLFSFGSLYAQSPKKTNIGIKAGLNHSIIKGIETNGEPTGFTGTDFYAAFFANTLLRNEWRLGAELLFSYMDDYHFIEFPVQIHYNVTDKIGVFTGPKLDFIVDSVVEPDDSGYDFETFGFSIETGVQYLITRKMLLEFRYSKGITDQINDIVLDINNGKRNTIRLGIGIIF
jgi:hypothetical protein